MLITTTNVFFCDNFARQWRWQWRQMHLTERAPRSWVWYDLTSCYSPLRPWALTLGNEHAWFTAYLAHEDNEEGDYERIIGLTIPQKLDWLFNVEQEEIRWFWFLFRSKNKSSLSLRLLRKALKSQGINGQRKGPIGQPTFRSESGSNLQIHKKQIRKENEMNRVYRGHLFNATAHNLLFLRRAEMCQGCFDP